MTENKERKRERDRIRDQERRKVLMDYKREQGCKDCGYNDDPRILEFDHLPEFTKIINVMRLLRRPWAVIWAEVAKCEVVCRNCHGIRTYDRMGC